jgi:hypothetical protein
VLDNTAKLLQVCRAPHRCVVVFKNFCSICAAAMPPFDGCESFPPFFLFVSFSSSLFVPEHVKKFPALFYAVHHFCGS